MQPIFLTQNTCIFSLLGFIGLENKRSISYPYDKSIADVVINCDGEDISLKSQKMMGFADESDSSKKIFKEIQRLIQLFWPDLHRPDDNLVYFLNFFAKFAEHDIASLDSFE